MKFSVQLKNPSRSLVALKDIISAKETDLIVQEGAESLRDALLFELDQTTLDVLQKEEIARSIQVSTLGEGGMSVSIQSPLAADIEFGSRLFDEEPWILRATQTALTKIESKPGRGEK